MKTLSILPLIFLAAALVPVAHGGGVYSDQQLMVNPFMTDGYEGWTPTSPWRDNGEQKSLVFDFNTDGPTGFFVATQGVADIKTVGKHVEDADFDANKARLTGLKFNGAFLAKAAEANASEKLNAKFYIEFDIVTAEGTYRGKSVQIENPWTVKDANFLDSNTDYTWETADGFLGYPFADSGIALSAIKSIMAKYVMEVAANNADGGGTVFATIDNASIEYEVTVPGE